MNNALTRCGLEPRHTPVDVLMQAPLGVHLAVAEELASDHDHPDDDLDGFTIHEDWEYAD